MVVDLLVFVSEGGEDEGDDVDDAGDHSDEDGGGVGAEVGERPAPGQRDDHCGGDGLPDVFEDEVGDEETGDAQPVEAVESQVDEFVEIGRSQQQQPQVDCDPQPVVLVEGEELTHGGGVADHQPHPDCEDEYIASDLLLILPEVTLVVADGECEANLFLVALQFSQFAAAGEHEDVPHLLLFQVKQFEVFHSLPLLLHRDFVPPRQVPTLLRTVIRAGELGVASFIDYTDLQVLIKAFGGNGATLAG